MPAGRSPPIIPSLAALTSSRSAGRKPPLPHKLAAQRMRERQRLAKGMKQIAAIGGAVGPPKRVDLLAARTAALHPAPARERQRTKENPRQKRDQEAAGEAQTTPADAPAPRSLRPPRAEPGRYAGLKNGQPD